MKKQNNMIEMKHDTSSLLLVEKWSAAEKYIEKSTVTSIY